jgi:hypothetical protein
MMDDPRVHEYRAALADLDAGLLASAGARERYRQAIGPYVACIAEGTPAEPEFVRREMMLSLFKTGLPLEEIISAFDASDDEQAFVESQMPSRAGRSA